MYVFVGKKEIFTRTEKVNQAVVERIQIDVQRRTKDREKWSLRRCNDMSNLRNDTEKRDLRYCAEERATNSYVEEEDLGCYTESNRPAIVK